MPQGCVENQQSKDHWAHHTLALLPDPVVKEHWLGPWSKQKLKKTPPSCLSLSSLISSDPFWFSQCSFSFVFDSRVHSALLSIARPLESCLPKWSKCLYQSMHNCRLWPSWGFLFPPNALEEQINKVCVPVPWVTAIFMVTSLSRTTGQRAVKHLTPWGVGGLSWAHPSLT